ncbi:hypothetical protein G7054_g2168 [Neopestalotiopsis clavispora]|nr:hypothetical protein G7054_g2168 [Neopestalotiopsis clavispora]
MPDPQPTLNDIAARISELTKEFSLSLRAHNVAEATFAPDSQMSYDNLPEDVFLLRQHLVDSLTDLLYLTQGPNASISNYVHNVMPDATALNVLNHFDFWTAVPLDGSASYSDISTHTKLPETCEVEPGKVSSKIQHTSRSAAVLKEPGLRASIAAVLDVTSPSIMILNQALERYSLGKPALTSEIKHTAFALLHSGDVFADKYQTSWEFLENDGTGDKRGWRQKDFVEFMRYIKQIFGLEQLVVDCFDWHAVGEARVVDVGGSAGHDAIVLARKFPNLTVVVQDMPKVQPIFDASLPTELSAQVSFVAHDIMKMQTIEADIFMVKLILHDYPEPEAAKILRALVPVLKTGNRVLVIEYIGNVEDTSEQGSLPRSIRQFGTSTDLRMMALFNAKERTAESYRDIFHDADARFDVTSIKTNPLSFFSVIEAVWEGS